ncbi:MAG: signal peptidase I [Sarcina sp.]
MVIIKNSNYKNKIINLIKELILPVIIAIIIALLIKRFLIFKVAVPTGSMIPTVQINDQIIVKRIYKESEISRGDILVFEKAGEENLLLKRVVGMPGEKININELGEVYVNGEILKEDYVKNPDATGGSFSVPEGHYFMLGDNRAKSEDARMWENPYTAFKDVVAKTWIRVYPFDSIGIMK